MVALPAATAQARGQTLKPRTLLDRATDLAALKAANPTAWAAIVHHRTHRNRSLDFSRVPALLQMYMERAREMAVRKGTQTGCSEYLHCRSIMSAVRGMSVFYVLPTLELVGRVVHNRFDRELDYTPFYRRYRQSQVENLKSSVRYKQVGSGAIAFVGSNAKAGFTEFPADLAIVDELDECNPENLSMAWERLSASEDREQVWAGQPTIPDAGIAAKYSASTGGYWTVKAACGHWTRPDFFRHVVRHEGGNTYRVIDREWTPGNEQDCRLICDRCGKPFDPKGAGEWVQERPTATIAGYHFDKLMSGNVTVAELLLRFEEGLVKPVPMQRFWNGDMGLPYMAPGANIGPELLDACRGEYALPRLGESAFGGWSSTPGLHLVGIDVQAGYFVVVIAKVDMARNRLRLIFAGEVESPEGSLRPLMQVFRDYRIHAGVVDAQPERRIAQMLCKRFRGMFMCFWAESTKRDTLAGKVVSVNRTAAIDQVRDAVTAPDGGQPYLELPANAREIPGFYEQVGVPVRVYNADLDGGRGGWEWKSGEKPDHYCMTLAYLLLARNMAMRALERRGPTLPGSVKTATIGQAAQGGDVHAHGDHQ